MDLSEESKEAQQEHARLLKQVEAERRARTMVVPTKTEDVAQKLRCAGSVSAWGRRSGDGWGAGREGG